MRTTSAHCGLFFPDQNCELVVIDIPKVLAIILVNESPLCTVSEIRTSNQNEVDSRQKRLHIKWTNIFYDAIQKAHPDLSGSSAGDLAIRNADYLKSAFSPITIKYSIDLKNLSITINRCKRFISDVNSDISNDFLNNLSLSMAEFVQQIEEIFKNNLKRDEIDGGLVSFLPNAIESTAYNSGVIYMPCLASLGYLFDVTEYGGDDINRSWSMPPVDKQEFITPHVIREYGATNLAKKWQKDISSIASIYPLGLLVKINESGLKSAFQQRVEKTMNNSHKLSFEMVLRACTTLYGCKNVLNFSFVQEDRFNFFPCLNRHDETKIEI